MFVSDSLSVTYQDIKTFSMSCFVRWQAFSFNGRAQTIFALDKSKEDLIGQVADKGLSFSDVKAVNLMYNCNGRE